MNCIDLYAVSAFGNHVVDDPLDDFGEIPGPGIPWNKAPISSSSSTCACGIAIHGVIYLYKYCYCRLTIPLFGSETKPSDIQLVKPEAPLVRLGGSSIVSCEGMHRHHDSMNYNVNIMSGRISKGTVTV